MVAPSLGAKKIPVHGVFDNSTGFIYRCVIPGREESACSEPARGCASPWLSPPRGALLYVSLGPLKCLPLNMPLPRSAGLVSCLFMSGYYVVVIFLPSPFRCFLLTKDGFRINFSEVFSVSINLPAPLQRGFPGAELLMAVVGHFAWSWVWFFFQPGLGFGSDATTVVCVPCSVPVPAPKLHLWHLRPLLEVPGEQP